MYADGPWWKPPILPFAQYGMPPSDDDDDFELESEAAALIKSVFQPIGANTTQFGVETHSENGTAENPSRWPIQSETVIEKEKFEPDKKMPSTFRNEFDSALNTLSPIRDLVGDLMALCLEQVEYAPEIVEAIVEAVMSHECNINQRLARMYLVSDILYNSTAVPKASRFRALFDAHLNPMFEKLHQVYTAIESRFVAEQFRTRISTVLRAWAAWSLYTSDALIKLNNIFM